MAALPQPSLTVDCPVCPDGIVVPISVEPATRSRTRLVLIADRQAVRDHMREHEDEAWEEAAP